MPDLVFDSKADSFLVVEVEGLAVYFPDVEGFADVAGELLA